ncbi:MAG: PepSY domain-containing protein, partial [Verrucomicrobia bacterium]|nr:PepSY domain-containing protein [Verrucomicrobiota bacterium]
RATDNEGKAGHAQLKAQATVSKAMATKTALAEVRNRGLKRPKVKEAELEQEKGLLIWSFDIATKGTKDITEVQVDAKTGAIVSVTTESAAAEAKERKGKKEKDEDERDEKK